MARVLHLLDCLAIVLVCWSSGSFECCTAFGSANIVELKSDGLRGAGDAQECHWIFMVMRERREALERLRCPAQTPHRPSWGVRAELRCSSFYRVVPNF